MLWDYSVGMKQSRRPKSTDCPKCGQRVSLVDCGVAAHRTTVNDFLGEYVIWGGPVVTRAEAYADAIASGCSPQQADYMAFSRKRVPAPADPEWNRSVLVQIRAKDSEQSVWQPLEDEREGHTMTDQMQEPWSRNRDEQHPVRWSPADGDTPAYLTLKGAVERLTRDGGDADETKAGLLQGRQYRTPFAFYQVDE